MARAPVVQILTSLLVSVMDEPSSPSVGLASSNFPLGLSPVFTPSSPPRSLRNIGFHVPIDRMALIVPNDERFRLRSPISNLSDPSISHGFSVDAIFIPDFSYL